MVVVVLLESPKGTATTEETALTADKLALLADEALQVRRGVLADCEEAQRTAPVLERIISRGCSACVFTCHNLLSSSGSLAPSGARLWQAIQATEGHGCYCSTVGSVAGPYERRH